MEKKAIVFDAGVREIQTFQDGVRSGISQYDNVDASADGGARNWTEIHTAFDTAGVIVTREAIFDTGVRKIETFENGVRSAVSQLVSMTTLPRQQTKGPQTGARKTGLKSIPHTMLQALSNTIPRCLIRAYTKPKHLKMACVLRWLNRI